MNTRGFSLVELLIVIAVIGVLATLSVGSYTKNILRTNRAEASTQMVMIQSVYESYYSQNNSYPAANTLPPAATIPSTAHYSYSTVVTTNGFTISATAIGDQANDTGCTTLTLDNLGNQLPSAC